MADTMYYVGPDYSGKIQLPDTDAWMDPRAMAQTQILQLLTSYPYLSKYFSNVPPNTGGGGTGGNNGGSGGTTGTDVDDDWAQLLYDEFVREEPNLTF